MTVAIKDAFTAIIGYVGEFVSALTATDGVLKDLLPVFVFGIGISLLLLAIKAVKSMTWGA